MKLTVTKEDLRQALLKATGIDIESTTVEVELEGYVKAKDYRLKAALPDRGGENPGITVTTDSNLNVLDLSFKESLPLKSKKHSYPKKRKKRDRNRYTGPVDYKEYEQEILDFATSNEDQREVPSFGLTLACVKERYKKVIRETNVEDMIRFSQINNAPHLVRIKEEDKEIIAQ
jgi:hypothetical protein